MGHLYHFFRRIFWTEVRFLENFIFLSFLRLLFLTQANLFLDKFLMFFQRQKLESLFINSPPVNMSYSTIEMLLFLLPLLFESFKFLFVSFYRFESGSVSSSWSLGRLRLSRPLQAVIVDSERALRLQESRDV